MKSTNAELIDRVAGNTGLHLPALAERLGLQERTLKRIRSGEVALSDAVRLHLLDLERLAASIVPRNGSERRREAAPSRLAEEPVEYRSMGDESMTLVLRRVTAAFTVKELATLISEIASDEDLPSNLRTRVVKILSEFIPERMK